MSHYMLEAWDIQEKAKELEKKKAAKLKLKRIVSKRKRKIDHATDLFRQIMEEIL